MLTLAGVSHAYGARTVLASQSFSLARDEHCLLIGPSGSGKSTLLHILAGILPPAGGEVSLQGEPLYPSGGRAAAWRAQRIGLVPQQLHLLPALSALDNVVLAQYFAGARGGPGVARALLASLGLTAQLHSKPAALSVGEQQRVAIARAVINRPQLVLADEPTSSLDDDNARQAIDLLFAAAESAGALLVVATHDARIGQRFARRVELGRPA